MGENVQTRAVRTVATIAAAAGVVPVGVAVLTSECLVALSSAFVALSGVFHTNFSSASEGARAVVDVTNAAVAVVFTLVLCYRAQTFATAVGALRVLLIVAVVSSTASYTTIRSMAPKVPLVPDDATLFALGAALVFFTAAVAVARCRQIVYARDPRFFFVEVTLVAGSFALRFEDEVARAIGIRVGWAVWYVCCHLAALEALFFLRYPYPQDNASSAAAT